MQKHVIWGNINLNINDWDFSEEERELTDEQKYEAMEEMNAEYLEDERLNLDIETEEDIIDIGDLGLWHGRVSAYEEILGRNISEILYCEEPYAEWYVDGYGNLRGTMIHHDGRNYILYREWRKGLSSEQKENFLEKIYRGKATKKDVSRYTTALGKYVRKVYGF